MEYQIRSLLQVSKNEYEVTVISNYIAWCRKFESKDKEAQRLLTSPSLFAWWMEEYRKLEAKFLQLAIPYKSYLSKKEMQELHRKETLHIHNLYSKPLIYSAKQKVQIIEGKPLAN